MTLVKRACPICESEHYATVVTLKQDHFINYNYSYRIDRIPELGLDPNQQYPIVSCSKCRMVYALYHLDEERENILYNRIIDPVVSKRKVLALGRKIGDLRRWMNLLALSDKNKSKSGGLNLKVLDYGCGWGTLLQVARGPGVFAVGFDTTSWKVTWAREQGITVCDSEAELFAYAPFDLCISTSVLEHLKEPKKALGTMASLLKFGGHALISAIVGEVAHPSGWKNIRKRLARGLPVSKEINPWEHLNYFTLQNFTKMLGNFGFVPVSVPGRWVNSNLKDAALLCGRVVLEKSLLFQRPNRWINDYWQFKPDGHGSVNDQEIRGGEGLGAGLVSEDLWKS